MIIMVHRSLRIRHSALVIAYMLGVWVLTHSSLSAQTTYSGIRIMEAAKSHVFEMYGATVKAEAIKNVGDQVFAQANIEARILDDEKRTASFINVVIEFLHGEKIIRKVSVPFRITMERLVPIATKRIAPGALISEEDIEWKERTVAANDDAITDPQQLVGRRSVAMIAAGEPIRTKYLGASNGIVRNQAVSMIIRTGNIFIRTQGKAMADAAPGETLQVLRTGGNTTILCKALGNGIVEVVR